MPVSHCQSACQFHIARISLSLSGTTQNAGCTAAGSEADCQRHLWLHWCHFLWPYALYWGKRFSLSPPCVWVGGDVGLEDGGGGCAWEEVFMYTLFIYKNSLKKLQEHTDTDPLTWWSFIKLNLKSVASAASAPLICFACACFFAHPEWVQCNHITVNQGVLRVKGKAAPEIISQMWMFLNSQ